LTNLPEVVGMIFIIIFFIYFIAFQLVIENLTLFP